MKTRILRTLTLPSLGLRPTLTYTLLYDIRPREEGKGMRSSFSLLCYTDNDPQSGVLLPDITSEKERAEEIFSLFSEQEVTPITAAEIMEEYLAR